MSVYMTRYYLTLVNQQLNDSLTTYYLLLTTYYLLLTTYYRLSKTSSVA